jgi:hypothetical protein
MAATDDAAPCDEAAPDSNTDIDTGAVEEPEACPDAAPTRACTCVNEPVEDDAL